MRVNIFHTNITTGSVIIILTFIKKKNPTNITFIYHLKTYNVLQDQKELLKCSISIRFFRGFDWAG